MDRDEPKRAIYVWLKRHRFSTGVVLAAVAITVVMLLPSNAIIPVRGTSAADWNENTFWYSPWGRSGVHKGVDIFAPQGTDVLAATTGVVVYAGEFGRGGRVALVLGAKWRLHYYAHLCAIGVSVGEFVRRGEKVGAVGSSGNAVGKPPHLHYSIVTLAPYPWEATAQPQGWKRMFYLDPTTRLQVGT